MIKIANAHIAAMLLAGGLLGSMCGPAAAAVRIEGQKLAVIRSQVPL